MVVGTPGWAWWGNTVSKSLQKRRLEPPAGGLAEAEATAPMSEARPRVLVVDDDSVVAEAIACYLGDLGYPTAIAHSGLEALEVLTAAESGVEGKASTPFAVAVVDMAMPGMDGLELIKSLRADHSDVVVVAITGYGTIEAAVRAIRAGAMDYLTKPLVDEELHVVVEKAVQQQALLAENTNLRRQLDQRYGLDSIVGADSRMHRIYDVIGAVAPSKTTVLMCGESGTGKSLIARAIHRNSPRAQKPYVEISCGSIPETLLESELFGHVKGAFTGAHADKAGRFFAAHTGSLFLDEIDAASPGMQLKLLRVLQERRFEPVGSNDTIEVDVRVILASNQPLEDLVAAGEFRQDLYYRINVVSIELPPLRERIGDIPLLAEHFLQIMAKEASRQITGFSAEAMDAAPPDPGPGDRRQLQRRRGRRGRGGGVGVRSCFPVVYRRLAGQRKCLPAVGWEGSVGLRRSQRAQPGSGGRRRFTPAREWV